MKPGIYYDMPEAEYHADQALGSGDLRAMLTSPAEFKRYRDNGIAQSDAMLLGSLVDCLLLEPDKLAERYHVVPDVRRGTKAWDEYIEAAAGREVVKQSAKDTADAMAAAVLSSKYAEWVQGRPQVSVFWEDPDTGLPCKARFDVLDDRGGSHAVTDLKTSGAKCAEDFYRIAKRFRYHVQGAHYLNGARAVGLRSREFRHLVVLDTPPHRVGGAPVGNGALLAGEALAKRALRDIALCSAADEWPDEPWPDVWELSEYHRDAELRRADKGVEIDVW